MYIQHITTTGDEGRHEEAVNKAIGDNGHNVVNLHHDCSISGDPVTGPYILFSTVLVLGGEP